MKNLILFSTFVLVLFLVFLSSVTLAHYCDDYYVEQQAREDCWWRYWTNNPTDADRSLSQKAGDPRVEGSDRPDINILQVGNSGSLRGYSAPPHTAFGHLNPSTFTWQGTVHIITDLAINLSHQSRDDWALMLKVLPAQLQNTERLTLRVGDHWFNFSDANRDGGGLYWQGVRPNWTAGDDVEVGIHVFPDFFVPRSMDGSGNHQTRPDRGRANSSLVRISPVDPTNNAYLPAPANSLPNPRTVSNLVFDQRNPVFDRYLASDMMWQWGQFIDHDIVHVPTGAPREAFPIPVPRGDPVFDPVAIGDRLIPFFRSAFDPSTGTGPDNPRQPVNNITSFIDGSGIYGSDPRRAFALRAHDGSGRLKMSGDRFLPPNTQGLSNQGGDRRPDLFLAGDIRANEQVGLTAMHTLFVREHNRLAGIIAAQDPELTGQEIFEWARKVNGAQIQVITYTEFLPMLLGPGALGPYGGYNSAIDPAIANEFASAAFRIGHSLLSPFILHIDANGATRSVSLDEAFFNPSFVRAHGISGLLLGLSSQQAQHLDTHVIDQVRNLLFVDPPASGSRDLAAINIQRGRDHGVPSYNDVRRAYGLTPVQSFADVSSDPAVQAKLTQAYGGDIDRLELWPGGLAEDHLSGAMLGETFHAIVADQFRRLRDGDRFWFENDPYFLVNPELLGRIRSVTLADVIRRNTPLGNQLPDNVFRLPDAPGRHSHQAARVHPRAVDRSQRPSTLHRYPVAEPVVAAAESRARTSAIARHIAVEQRTLER